MPYVPDDLVYCGHLTHFGHNRIIRYCNRPFSSAEEMEQVMLEKFNSRIKRGDILYHLGDVCWSSYDMGRFFGQLNTKQCHLILGNHDKKHVGEYKKWFSWVGDYKSITVGSVPVRMFHYPMRSWNAKGHGAIHLYGHCHGTVEPGLNRSMDVGVDPMDFAPISYEEVYERLSKKPIFDDMPMGYTIPREADL